ncbi:unnamed protein product [Blumeria hordei]|uniref:Uncharacterized protein n=1 Tax=Blumeria hordei TaxID=2867405 RepID=A0A383UMK8_BLUHO|nr:unnamed protein product [Blumeria hordei]
MLRRKPTAIMLTTEDIAIYEDARACEAANQQQEEERSQQQQNLDQNERESSKKPEQGTNVCQSFKDQSQNAQNRIFGEESSSR